MRNVELKQLFPKLASPKGAPAGSEAARTFKTQGNSVGAMFGAANGEGAMIMRGGEASTLTLVMTNLDLARAAALLLQGDKTSEIRCAVASFGVANGQMAPQLMVIDTSAVTINGEGSIDFRDEKYDLHLKAQLQEAEPACPAWPDRRRRDLQDTRRSSGDGPGQRSSRRCGRTGNDHASAGASRPWSTLAVRPMSTAGRSWPRQAPQQGARSDKEASNAPVRRALTR